MTVQRSLLVLLLLAYGLVAIWDLPRIPAVHQDEPWIASVGWKFARDCALGSVMFVGFYGMDQRYFEFMPVYPLLQALVFKTLGVGLTQARAVSVAFGLLTLIFTYSVGRRLFSVNVGVLAVGLLLGLQLTATSATRPFGIMLLDTARVARYDIAASAFGLIALYAFLSATTTRGHARFALAGLFTALSSLSHLYGLFWLPALALLVLLDARRATALAAFLAGFAAPWLIYAGYVLSDLPDWRGQLNLDRARFELLDPGWYLANILNEPRRFATGFSFETPTSWLRPGLLSAAIALPFSLALIARQAAHRRAFPSIVLITSLASLSLGMTLLVHLKTPAYAILLYPLLAIAMARGIEVLWSGGWAGRWRAASRALIGFCLLASFAEGSVRAGSVLADHERFGDYTNLTQQLVEASGTGSPVLGLHTFWFGFEDRDYRTWFVPITQTDDRFWSPPKSIETALSDVSPEVVIIDPATRTLFDSNDRLGSGVHGWLESRNFLLRTTIRDSAYGTFEIYARSP